MLEILLKLDWIRDISSGVRLEAQFNHQKNDIDSASALGVTLTAGGDATINVPVT